jgi:hypothetical protein
MFSPVWTQIHTSIYISFMIFINGSYYAVNYTAYLRRLTSKGKTACSKRVFERILPEIKLTKDRITNPYKSMEGSQVPIMLSIRNYVVLQLPRCIKQPVTSSKLIDGSPKVSNRRKHIELGISRNMEIWRRRRTRSTDFIFRKGSRPCLFVGTNACGF